MHRKIINSWLAKFPSSGPVDAGEDLHGVLRVVEQAVHVHDLGSRLWRSALSTAVYIYIYIYIYIYMYLYISIYIYIHTLSVQNWVKLRLAQFYTKSGNSF